MVLGLPGWFRHAYFEYHAHVRLRFKQAPGLGEPWNRDGSFSSGLSSEHDVHCCVVFAMVSVFICSWRGFSHSCMLIILNVFLRIPDLLLNAARFTTGYVRLVGQEPAPSKCVLFKYF